MDSPRIDWESILRRTRMAADEALSEAELQRVFAERAEQLAHRSQDDATERGQELFRFTLLVRGRSEVLTTRYSEQKQLRKAGELKAGLGVK